jgi:BlaI family transcriptional regulator, penicillinase repressor
MDIVLHERELEIMQVLWERGSATAAEVHGALTDDLAYTTVLTILRRLEAKGYVAHEEEGRAHRFLPTVEAVQARESALQRLTHGLFQGSAELVLTHLVSREKLSDAQLRRLKELVGDELKRGER